MINKDASNLSIIIQGPFNENLKDLISVYLTKHPLVEIIVIGWLYEKSIFEDKLRGIKNKVIFFFLNDPGGQTSELGEKLNVNRQLLSTQKGLQLSKREYSIKLRSDFKIDINKTILIYNKYQRNSFLSNLKKSVMIINLTSVNPKYSKRFFALCDWLYLGLTEDLTTLISSDVYPMSYLNYKLTHNSSLRYNAEQWMILKGVLGNNFEEIMPHSYSSNEVVSSLQNKLIKSIIIANPSRLKLKSFKYLTIQFGLWRMYTFKEWKKEYYDNYTYFFDIDRVLYNCLKYTFKLKKIFK